MSKAIVAIVGRPNVGKSTLFNALSGTNTAIVKDTPGVTRDRIYADVHWLNHNFTLIDTGGIEPDSKDIILSQMREQAQIAIDMADVIIFMTDVKSGLQDDDRRVCNLLRRSKKPIILVVNKVDDFQKFNNDVYEFYNLGLEELVPISSVNRLGIGDMLDKVVNYLNITTEEEQDENVPKVAIIGKPNVGKSSLINKIAKQDRLIVSDIAGTTRDAIDTPIEFEGKNYIFIDTAGLRRQKKIFDEIERYSIVRTVSAVKRCDVAVIMIDATEGITSQDAKIAGIAHEEGRGIILVVNKWDAVEKDDKTIYKFRDKIRATLPFLNYADLLFVSAQTGLRVNKLFEMIDSVIDNQLLRISTGVLNEVVTDATLLNQPPSDKGKRLKIYYVTQISVAPPTFVIFVNDKELMHFSYVRYLENKIREAFGFSGTRIKFIVRERKDNDK